MKKNLLKITGIIFILVLLIQNVCYADVVLTSSEKLEESILFTAQFVLPALAVAILLIVIISFAILKKTAERDKLSQETINQKKKKITKYSIILFVILGIISIATIYIMLNPPRNTGGGTLPPEQEMMVFNSKFAKFEGKQRGSVVNALAQTVISNNTNQKENDSNYFVEINGEMNINKESTNFEKLDASKYYVVTIIKYQDGRVTQITVTEYEESVNN